MTRIYKARQSRPSVRKSGRRPSGRKSRQTKSRRSRQRSVSSASITSPVSGRSRRHLRWIAVGGPAYRDLLRLGYTDSQLKRGGVSYGREKARRRYSSRSGQRRPSNKQRKMRVSSKSRSSTLPNRGRGSRTKGWSKVVPRRGRPRHELMKKCEKKCYLDPEHEAFPVCASLSSSGGKCELDCRGVQAAKIRAKQYGYTNIYRAADKLYREKCSK